MPASKLDASAMLPGLHRVRNRSKAAVTEYWYAWRGGPQILKVKGRSDAEVDRLVSEQASGAVEAYKAKTSPLNDTITLHGLITRFLVALEDMPGADRTKADLRKYLDKVRTDLGLMEIKALEARGARKVLIDWRNRYKATPKVADERMNALNKVIKWAIDGGELAFNPIDGVEPLYVPPDRSEIIWEPHHLAILLEDADQEFRDFVDVACHGGLRSSDNRIVPLKAVGHDAIVFQTGKSNRRRTVVVPITDEFRVILAGIINRHRGETDTLLASSLGETWSEAGIGSAMRRHKLRALERARAKHGPKATSGIEHLRIHDMRGTAATNFIRAGLGDDDIATILGWKEAQVAEIRRRYVSGQEIGLAIVQRMKANKEKNPL